MLLTTGIIALSRKVQDEKEKKKEAKQGKLKIGDSGAAKEAFAAQSTRAIEAPPAIGIDRVGTEIKYEDPNEVGDVRSPDTDSPSLYSPRPDIQDARKTSQLNVASPVESDRGLLSAGSPINQTPSTPTIAETLGNSTKDDETRPSTSERPPSYSSRPGSSLTPLSPANSSVYSRDVDAQSIATTRSTNSQGTHSLRIKTVGDDLKSGFPYHPSLFELRVHPDKWNHFAEQIVESTKFNRGDHAQVWATATSIALTGFIGTSVIAGKTVKRNLREKKVREGLNDMSDGGLGDTLKEWNEQYFNKLGLFVHLELSESAMKNADQKSRYFRKPSLAYSKREEREKKRDERKFVVVVTKLDDDGKPMEAMKELGIAEKEGDIPEESIAELPGDEDGPVEIGSSGDPRMNVAELPADEGKMPAELDADFAGFQPGIQGGPTSGYVEMDGDNTQLMAKLHISENSRDGRAAEDLTPRPLNVPPTYPAQSDEKKMT